MGQFHENIGATLIHRTRHRYQPMTLTPRGRGLLDHLDRRDVRELLSRHAPLSARQY